MNAKPAAALALLLLVASPLPFQVSGAPSVAIASPGTGAMLLARTVDLNGTARGSAVDWQETLHDDFDTGTLENLSNDAAGTLALNRSMYDIFDGSAVDPGRWAVTEANGLTAGVGGGKLQLGGSGKADGWTSLCQLVTTGTVSERINGTLDQFMEVGTGAYSVIGLYQDDRNYMAVGRGVDFFGLGPGQKVVLVSSVSGCFTMESLGPAANVPHTFNVTYDGTNAVLYMDGSQLATRAIALNGARCIIRAAVNATGDFVNAAWDDVSCGYFTFGRFTSAVYDTLSDSPDLSSVAWTSNVPAGLSLGVQLRSADDPMMNGASNWLPVTNGQSNGFPAFRQYLQYTVAFGSPSGNGTALFRDITVKYICGVRTVEVSIDNRTTWAQASGKEDWNISLDIPDGTTYIWARVKDVTGEIQITSVVVDVDTTAPTVSLSINDGAETTSTAQVSLTLLAADAYGVRSMMVSEDALFAGAQWQAFAGRLDWTLSEGDGPKAVYAKVRDANGWESPPAGATILLDTRPPTGSIRINAGANYTKTAAVTLSLNASDASGVSEMLLSNRNDFSGEDWLPYSTVYPWTLLPGHGVRTVHARFRDPSGQMSEPVSATILLDTVLPEFLFTIENGSAYARAYAVELQLNATDNNAMGGMLVSQNVQFQGATWEPWAATRSWVLTSGEGAAHLFAKVRDLAENEAPAQTATIMVDTVAPDCVVSSLPAIVTSAVFNVSWNGNDATSGITGYDVQYREGSGAWTDWLLLVANTTAAFTGQDGSTYTFRARAHDLAGNAGAYPVDPRTTTTVRLPSSGVLPPVVSILTSVSSAPYTGKVRFEGTARALTPGRTVVSVQWQIDEGAWLPANGSQNWSFVWNTAGASPGPHTLRVRCFDGQNHSAVVERTVVVDNQPAPASEGGPDMILILLVLVVAIAAGAAAGVFILKRKKGSPAGPASGRPVPPTAAAPGPAAGAARLARPVEEPAGAEPAAKSAAAGAGPAGEPPEAAALGAGEAAEGTPAPPGEPPEAAALGAGEAAEGTPAPSGEAAAATPATAGAGAPAAETPSALPPINPTPYPLTEPDRHLDPALILPVVQAVYPGIPGELRMMPPEDITELVVTAERSRTRTGETLVLIMGRWYFGDEGRPNFLHRYNW